MSGNGAGRNGETIGRKKSPPPQAKGFQQPMAAVDLKFDHRFKGEGMHQRGSAGVIITLLRGGINEEDV